MDLSKLEKMTDEQYLALPQEEREAIKAALAQRQQDAQVLTDQSVQEEQMQEIPNDIKNSNVKSALVGAAQGLSFGFADEITSGMLATKHAIESTQEKIAKQGMAGFDNFLPTWKETYNKAQNGFNEAITDLKKKHPEEFDASYAAGAIGTGLLLGGTELGMMASKSLVGRLGMMGAEGFLHGAGQSSAETLGGVVKGAAGAGAQTAAFGGIIEGAAKGVGKLGVMAVRKVAPKRIIEFFSDDMTKFVKETNMYKKEDQIEFASRIVDYTDDKGRPILTAFQTAEDAKTAISSAVRSTGTDLGKIVSTIDDTKLIPTSDIDSLVSRLNKRVIDRVAVPTSKIGSSTRNDLKEKLQKRLTNDLFMDDPSGAMIKLADKSEVPKKVAKEWSLADLIRYKNELNDDIKEIIADKSKASQESFHLTRLRDEIHHFVNEKIESVSHKFTGDNAELYSLYRQSSQKYRDLITTDKLLDKKLKNPSALDFYSKVFKDSWGKITLGTVAASYMFGVQETTAGAAIGAISLMAANPKMNKALSMSLTRIVDAAKKNPAKYDKFLNRVAVAADVSGQSFFDNVTRLGAEVDFGEQPLNRTTEDLINRKDSLLAIAGDINPELRTLLEEGFRTEDSKAVATMILNTPELAKYVSNGIGWDGMAVTDADKKAVGSYLQKLKPRARKNATQQFSSTGAIPEGMLQGKGREPEKQLIFKKAKDKVRKPRF